MERYNGMIDGKDLFDQLLKNAMRTYYNICKITTGHGDDYTGGFLLDYPYFKDHYKMIAKHLSKQKALDAHPETKQKINFTKNLNNRGGALMFSIIEETTLDFPQEIVRVLQFYFCFYLT